VVTLSFSGLVEGGLEKNAGEKQTMEEDTSHLFLKFQNPRKVMKGQPFLLVFEHVFLNGFWRFVCLEDGFYGRVFLEISMSFRR